MEGVHEDLCNRGWQWVDTYHNGFGWVHGQAADRHEMALEGLGQVECLHIHRGEAQP